MVDHPDFCSDRELEKAKATMPLQLLRDRADDDDDSTENGGDDDDGSSSKKNAATSTAAAASEEVNALARFNPGSQRRSLSSIRSGVTVAMVAVALGFACCEYYMCARRNYDLYHPIVIHHSLTIAFLQAKTYCTC